MRSKRPRPAPCPPECPPKTPLARRPRLEPELLRRLAELFGVLSSETRLRVLHAVARHGEISVQAVARELGMKVAAVSNQLRLMSNLGVLGYRTEGPRVYYTLVDPCVPRILDTAACLAVDAEKRSRSR